jgi:PAS domain-containing protein
VEDCPERIRLVDEYSRSVTDYSARRDLLKLSPGERNEVDWSAAESSLAESQHAWEALQRHISEHQCLALSQPSPSQIMGHAAAAALDGILVADDQRRFVDVNEAAASVLGLPRNEIVGRRIDEFFSEARGESVPAAWNSFVSEGVQCGICELEAPGRLRRFEYRAKANFVPGFHLSILRGLLTEPRAEASANQALKTSSIPGN